MSWYKIFSGTPQDPKLAVIARRTGFRRGDILAIWIALHDHACTVRPRGSVAAVGPEEIAAALEFDPAVVAAVIKALRDKEMILPDGMLSGWAKNQKLSTSRTRTHRARHAVAAADAVVHETDAARRERLQGEMNARRNKHSIGERP